MSDKPSSGVLELIRMHYPDYHPLVSIAHLAHSEDEAVDARLKFDCHKTIARFVQPELKAVELKGTFSSTRKINISLFDESDVMDVDEIPVAVLEDRVQDF